MKRAKTYTCCFISRVLDQNDIFGLEPSICLMHGTDKIRYALLSHKEKFLQGVFKHTHSIQNVNTQMRIQIWTVYIKTKVHVTPVITAKWNTVRKLN